MRILVAQINPTVGDLAGNAEKIIAAIKRGKSEDADLVLFPEMALSGYPPDDLLLMPSFITDVEQALRTITPHTFGITAVVGLPRHNPGIKEKAIFNSAAVIRDGGIVKFHDKILLPTYDVFDERRFFEPGSQVTTFTHNGQKIGVTICEDIWQHSDTLRFTSYYRDPVQELAEHQPDLVLNLSSSPYSFEKPYRRLKICGKAAETLQCPLVLCNQVGGDDSLIFDGYSFYVDVTGELLAHAKGFEEDWMVVDTEQHTQPVPFHDDSIGDLYRALVLGLKDYMHKQGFRQACLGLSGGIDSAVTACLAVEALGAENVLGVSMPSRYSSEHSQTDAAALAKNLGIRYITIPIESAFTALNDLLQPHFEGRPPDVTEENLQSRIRGMILMSLSNKLGHIVLSTGNKSESAMGYTTLYGDMAGGLAVISDVTKMQIYALARYINRNEEIIPENTIEKPPSAELRPNQLDSDSLPEYSILDAVLQDYVELHLDAEQIARKQKLDVSFIKELIRKIHLNEFKRRQAPPTLRVSEKSLTRGRSFPIVQKWVK